MSKDKNPKGGRAKHVLGTDEIPHAWAHPLEKDGSGFYQTHATNPQGNLFYKTSQDGTRVLYSYRESYPIGSLFEVKKGKTVRRVYLTHGDKPYSNTTASHINMAKGAVPKDAIHWSVLQVVYSYSSKPAKAEHVENVEFLASEYAQTVAKLNKAKSAYQINRYLTTAQEQRKDAIDYAEFFKVKTLKLAPVPVITAERREQAKTFDATSEDRRDRISQAIQARHQARLEASNREWTERQENERKTLPERIAKWRAGESVGYLNTDYAVLRLSADKSNVETSQGVKVPVNGQAGAARLFRFLKAIKDTQREYKRNEHTEHIGNFAVDNFAPEQGKEYVENAEPGQYILTAGCHKITWNEIEALAPAVLQAETKERQ